MEAIAPSHMWEECQAYDAAHAGAKLDKVENYIANENFPAEQQLKLDLAESILFIEEAYINRRFRGQGLSLLALDLLIKELAVGQSCVVLLQTGPINSLATPEGFSAVSATESYEKIARNWRRMGFSEWSYSDDAWLCLCTEDRPKIESVVPNLFLGNSVA